ncbi:MAG: PP2C family protein-serine/threonine phosphatase [Bacteroidetes bacterium]|nr:PP2C family protein-serine/threonine phosphatase [Bacteroidota bacterium]
MMAKLADINNNVDHLQAKLQLKTAQLNALLEITQAINSNLSAKALLELFSSVMHDELGVNNLAIFTLFDEWRQGIHYGVDEEVIRSIQKDTILKFKHISHLKLNKSPLASVFKMVVPVYHKDQPMAVCFLGNAGNLKGETEEERLNFIQIIINIIAVAIENKKLFKEKLEQQGIKKELELAGKMQTMLIPEKLPANEFLEMDAIYMPHLDIGGDYYDYLQLNEDEYMFCMGDISGHGIAAALLMANFQASLRSLIMQQDSLKDFISLFNTKINEITRGEKFITLFLARYNTYNRKLHFINAGQTPPVFFSKRGVQLLDKGCTILGMFEKLPNIQVGELSIEHDDFLFCYTDGLTELENEQGEQYGIDRLATFVQSHHQLPVSDFNRKILDEIIRFKGSKSIFNDDVSFLTARFL